MSLELVVAGALLTTLTLYVLTGVADFGAGAWYLAARGKRAPAQRALIDRALAPIWEVNHVWLIIVLVLLFAAFPSAFTAIMTSLHIPVTLLLVGIVLRGASFAFHHSDVPFDQRLPWGRLFAVGSLVAPFWLGVVLGSVAAGMPASSGSFISRYVEPWLAPFPLAVGVFTTVLALYLAAAYLTVEAQGGELQDKFRLRAIGAGIVAAGLEETLLLVSREGAPLLWDGLTGTVWGALAQFTTAVAGLTGIGCLWFKRYRWARFSIAGQVTVTLWSWGLAQWPYLVPPHLTIYNAAAPTPTLRAVLYALGGGAVLVFPALWYLFRIFKQQTLFGGDAPKD
ncbi:MAG: cytochrome d ubiquinol oxidase subunit II [Nitrospira sp.]|nr:cytochrome d ubiquinol oxidase subunit II [Nitrospira sp.]